MQEELPEEMAMVDRRKSSSVWRAAVFSLLTLFSAANCADQYDGKMSLLVVLWAIMAVIGAGSTVAEIRGYLRSDKRA